MKTERPLILVTNDDGYAAKGIDRLITFLRPLGDLFVMAPDGPRSGKSCSFTAEMPIKYRTITKEEGLTICACTGTPVDCVKLALDEVMERQPTLIVSGINHGSNASVNAHYSGTVGAATEGCMKGIPSIAFSLCDHSMRADFEPLQPYIVHITEKILVEGLPAGALLNVNFPKSARFEGIKVCRMSQSRWVNEIERREHPFGREYFWLAGEQFDLEPQSEDSDLWALDNNYVAVTPLTIDVTHYGLFETLRFS